MGFCVLAAAHHGGIPFILDGRPSGSVLLSPQAQAQWAVCRGTGQSETVRFIPPVPKGLEKGLRINSCLPELGPRDCSPPGQGIVRLQSPFPLTGWPLQALPNSWEPWGWPKPHLWVIREEMGGVACAGTPAVRLGRAGFSMS